MKVHNVMEKKKKVNSCVFQGMLQLVSFQKEYCFFDNNT